MECHRREIVEKDQYVPTKVVMRKAGREGRCCAGLLLIFSSDSL